MYPKTVPSWTLPGERDIVIDVCSLLITVLTYKMIFSSYVQLFKSYYKNSFQLRRMQQMVLEMQAQMKAQRAGASPGAAVSSHQV